MSGLKARQASEMTLWRRWQSGDKKALGALLKSYDPVVHTWMNKLQSSPLPRIFIQTEVKKQVVDAFQTFDPKRGVQLNTHVNSRLPKVLRNTVYTYGNLGRIPEERQRKIFTFQGSKDRLSDDLGRSPTAMEVAADLGWNLREVERMEKELRPSRMLTEESEFSFVSDDGDQKTLQYVYMTLPPKQQLLFEHHFGWAGKPKLKDQDLAKEMKLDVRALRKEKKSLATTLEKAFQMEE